MAVMAGARPKIPRPALKPRDDGHGSGTRKTAPPAPHRPPQKTLLGIPGPSGARPSRMPHADDAALEVIQVQPALPMSPPLRNRDGQHPPPAPSAAKSGLGQTMAIPEEKPHAVDPRLVPPLPVPSSALTQLAADDGAADASRAGDRAPVLAMPIHSVGSSRAGPVGPAAAPAAVVAPQRGLKLPPLEPIPRRTAERPAAFEDEAPTRKIDLSTLAREQSGARRRAPSVPDTSIEPAVLLVGFSDELCAALTEALGRHTVFVEVAEAGAVVPSVTVAAPDLVVLMGDGDREDTKRLLDELASTPLSSVVPVALVTDDPALGARLSAFRHGAAAVIPRSASVSTLAERINQLVREIPERGDSLGRVGEATLAELVDTLAHELRSGILSVKQAGGERESVRLVLGRGRPLATMIDEFVHRVRSQIEHAEPLLYEFDERAMGTVEFLAADFDDEPSGASIEGLRVILADDDSARADAVAQELRSNGAQVVVTDLQPSQAHLGRLRQLDPMVLVIGDAQLQGAGYYLVKTMREHRRLRWASLLVVHWDEIWSEERGVPHTRLLLNRLAGLAEPERLIATRLATTEPTDTFDTRLEALGPARLLRALVSDATLRVTVRNPRYYAQVSMAQGLVAGAVGFTQAGARLEGPQAIAALLNLGSGRVHVELDRASNSTNLMSTVDVALGLAEVEEAPIPESLPAPPPSDLPPALPRIATQPAGLNLADVGYPQPAATHSAAAELGVRDAPLALSDGSDLSQAPGSLRPPPARGLSRHLKLMVGVGAGVCALLVVVLIAVLAGREAPAPAAASVSLEKEPPVEVDSPQAPGVASAAPGEPAATTDTQPAPTAPGPAGEPAAQGAPGSAAVAGAGSGQPPSGGADGLPVPLRTPASTCAQALKATDPPAGGRGAAAREIERGKKAIIAGDLQRAQRAYCQALHLAPDDARAASGLGLVLMMLGDGEQAVQYFERALKAQEDDDATRQLLGDALALSGRYAEARAEWRKAAGVTSGAPADVEPLAHISQTKADQSFAARNYLRAERLYRRAVVLSPRRVDAAVGLAQTLLRGKRQAEALSWAKHVVAQRPSSAALWILLGDVQAATGDKASARDSFMKARELDPKNAEVAHRLR